MYIDRKKKFKSDECENAIGICNFLRVTALNRMEI